MQRLQDDYLAAYRSLKLNRDSEGVLVAEFHSNDGPFTFTAQDHTEFVDAFYRMAQDRANKIVILTGAGGGLHPRDRFFILRQRCRSRRLGPGSRRRRSASRKHSQHTRAGHRGYRGTRSCALRICATCECDCGGRGCDLPRCAAFRGRHCAR